MSYPRNYGTYVLLERLGVGGMSEIDLARRVVEDAGFMRFLVIKRIKADKTDDEAFVRMFKDEARISAELHHTNIAQVYDFGKLDDEYYLVLEYVPGIDVRRMINVMRDRGAVIPLRITLRLVCDLLAGLHYAHTRTDTFGKAMKIVHRDVNPRNIMVSIRGDVKLIDFGVAKATDRLERTHTDHVKGKFAYMAPEQVSGKEIDGRCDVFAAALTLHEMITGAGPFVGLNQVQIMHRLLNGQIPDLPAHPDLSDATALRRVQKKALATKPEDRYADADAYRRDLERVAERLGGLASQKDLSDFVKSIEPDFDALLRAKMMTFSGPVENLQTTMELPAVHVTGEVSGSLSKANTNSHVTYTNISARSAGVAAVGGLAAAVGAAVVGALVLTGLILGGLWYGDALGTAGAHPGTVDDGPGLGEVQVPNTPVVPDQVVPEGVAAPPEVERRAPGAGGPVTKERPGSADAVPAADPVDPIVAPVVETPVDAPATVTSPLADPPTIAAPADPVPAGPTGTLQITSTEKGRAILINGQPTPYVTPAKFTWPAGDLQVSVEGYAVKNIALRPRLVQSVTFQ